MKCYASTRKEWREWLRKNHLKEDKVYLIKYKKHTKKTTLTNKEAMEEAICFGWIDTTVKRLDEDRYQQCFVKRKNNAKWSKNTLSYAQEMIKKRKMTKAGLAAYKKGLMKPPIDHNLPKNPDIPFELNELLKKDKDVLENFSRLAPSYKRYYIYWIEKAIKKETRDKRIKEVFKRIKKNLKPTQ